MSDRGEYASIPRALAHGPDFQALPERARWVFVMMCLTFNGVGIEVRYPDSLAFELSAQTGATTEEVKAALNSLEEEGWIRREANVIWLCGRLEHSGLTLANPKKHIPHVRKVVLGLPHLQIVREFVEKYRAWFVEDPQTPDGPLANGFSWMAASLSVANPRKKTKRASLSIGNRSSTDSQEGSKKVPDQTNTSGADAPVGNWVAAALEILAPAGEFKPGRIGSALKPVVDRYGWSETESGLRDYVNAPSRNGKKCPEYFAAEAGTWVVGAREPMVGDGGVPTARMDRLLGVAS